MLARGVRHLLVRRPEDHVIVGMLSVKDIVKCAHMKHEARVRSLESVIHTQTFVSSPY